MESKKSGRTEEEKACLLQKRTSVAVTDSVGKTVFSGKLIINK